MCPPDLLITLLIMPRSSRFGKFIIQAIKISYNHSIKAAYGTLSTQGLPDRGIGEKLLPRGREDAAHPARNFAGHSEAGIGFAGAADRPLRQRTAAHRRRTHCLRLRAAV